MVTDVSTENHTDFHKMNGAFIRRVYEEIPWQARGLSHPFKADARSANGNPGCTECSGGWLPAVRAWRKALAGASGRADLLSWAPQAPEAEWPRPCKRLPIDEGTWNTRRDSHWFAITPATPKRCTLPSAQRRATHWRPPSRRSLQSAKWPSTRRMAWGLTIASVQGW